MHISFSEYRWLLELYITKPVDGASYDVIPKVLSKLVSGTLFYQH